MRNGAAWKKRIGYALLSVVTAWQTLAGHDLTTADLRPRLIVETDAGGDPDDEATLERLLMFSNQFELEVIIDDRSNSQIESRSTYQTEVKNAGGDGEDLVEKYIRDYGDLHANLSLHADGYPTEAKLKAITVAGHEGTNAGRDAIIAAVDADDPRPVWYGNWGSNSGTTSNLKRALDHVQAARTQAEYEEFASRLRICSLDGNTGTRQGHIDVIKLHIETGYPDISGRWYHQFQPITQTAGGFDINRDVRNNHGTLGAHYTTQKEGDSWCIVHLQNQAVGLAVPTRVRWGGWGGRYAGLRSGVNFPNNAFYWNDQADTWAGSTNRNNTAARFADDMQHHFAARFDWGQAAVYADANHAPVAVVNGDSSGAVVRLFAVPGQQVALSAAGSSDPDGDSIAYEWIRYDEADSYSGSVSISGATTRDAIVSIPGDAGGTDIHLYLEVSDNGDATPAGEYPGLKAYRRMVIYVREQLRIMPLGDSITDGSHWSDNGNGAYRRNLWNLMQAAGWNADLVGVKQNGGADIDQDHAGYIGYRIDELYGDADGTEPDVNLASQLDSYQPDIILLIIGANDALQDTDIPNADHRYVQLLNLIYAHCPDALVVMGNVQVMEKSGYDPARGVAINDQMPGVVTAAYHIGLWPEFLDLHALLEHPADFCADKVHPNQQGDDKIGQAFFDILGSLRASGTINIPPVADAGPDQSLADSDGLAGESVMLDGSGSYDPDGTVVSYSWEEDGVGIASGVNPVISLGDGEHTINLLVTDDGGLSHSDAVVITVTGPPDYEDPTAPADLLVTATGYDSVTLEWTAATDNIGVAFYDIFENGSLLTSVVGDETEATITGLSPATAYTFTVCARDAWGNLSTESNAAIVVTPAAPPAFLESSGLLVMEAENHHRNNSAGDPWYAESTLAGYVGSGYVTTLDDGTANGAWETADDLSYDFILETDGTYTIWMRISQAGGAGNSAYVGVDGTGGSFDNGSVSGWGWVKHGTTFTLGIGEHVFNLRRREDGYRVDRILLTTEAGYTPAGDGPAESAQGDGGSGFAVWAGALIVDPLKRGSNDDPEGDGVANLIEYALGLDPRIPDGPGRLPEVSINGGFLELEYFRYATLTDITYLVEASGDLQGWSVVYTSEGDTFASGPALFTDSWNPAPSDKRFLRLRIEQE